MDGPSTPAQPTEEELFEDQNISIQHFGVDEPEENIHLGPEDVKVGTKGWSIKKVAFFLVIIFGQLPTSISWKRFIRFT